MRLIDADALERDGWRMSRTVEINEKTMELQTRMPTDFPAVEPQPEIIRCKDCKYIAEHHYEENGEPPYIKYTCAYKAGLAKGYQVHEWDFCSRAKRRQDGPIC